MGIGLFCENVNVFYASEKGINKQVISFMANVVRENSDITREEIIKILTPVADRQGGMAEISLFTARCAFRALPFLAIDQQFSYWDIYKDQPSSKGDQRLTHLLAIWRAALCAYVQNSAAAAVAEYYAGVAVSAARKAQEQHNVVMTSIGSSYPTIDADFHAMYAGSAARISHLAAKTAMAVSEEERIAAAATTAKAAFNATSGPVYSTAIFPIRSAIHDDLATLGSNASSLTSSSLWSSAEKLITIFTDVWLDALQALEVEVRPANDVGASLLKRMRDTYQRIVGGGFSQEEAESFLANLDEYFQGVELRASHQESLPSSADPPTNFRYIASRQQLAETTSYEDHLNRQPLISALAAVMAHKNNHSHQTIGLLGDWGIGKSTWIGLLKKELLENHSEQRYLFGEFNAWAYEHTDNQQAGIAQEMMKALTSLGERVPKSSSISQSRGWCEKARQFGGMVLGVLLVPVKWLGRQLHALVLRVWLLLCFAICSQTKQVFKLVFALLLSVIPFLTFLPEWLSEMALLKAIAGKGDGGVLGQFLAQALWVGGFGFYFIRQLLTLMANPMAKEFLTYLKLPNYAQHLGTIPVMRENLKAMCAIRLGRLCGKPKRMVFVVDDLDRCGHKGIVKVFEAVRLALDVDNVTVIIAVDQHIALAALALHYEDLAKHHKLKNSRAIARDYLAKVIHLPIILTKPMGADIENYLQKLWLGMTSETDRLHIDSEERGYMTQQSRVETKVAPAGVDRKDPFAHERKPPENEPPEPINDFEMLKPEQLNGPEELKESSDKLVEVASLSAAQRVEFIFWLDYFGLSNPRQLKRLNNSYNLLRSYRPEIDREFVILESDASLRPMLFPMMITLIVLEYMNSMEDKKLRRHLRTQLMSGDNNLSLNDARISAEFIVTFDFVQQAHEHLIQIVEPFVLPAIE